jgi:DNA-binding response OmpR family regulator
VEAWDKKSMLGYLSVNNRPVDLIIMDLGLRNESGYSLMEYIRSNPKHTNTPIIILTGNAKKDAVIASVPYTISYYVVKPINPYDLSLKVLTALESRNKINRNSNLPKAKDSNNQLFQDYSKGYFEDDFLDNMEGELKQTNMSKINKVLDVDISPIKNINGKSSI